MEQSEDVITTRASNLHNNKGKVRHNFTSAFRDKEIPKGTKLDVGDPRPLEGHESPFRYINLIYDIEVRNQTRDTYKNGYQYIKADAVGDESTRVNNDGFSSIPQSRHGLDLKSISKRTGDIDTEFLDRETSGSKRVVTQAGKAALKKGGAMATGGIVGSFIPVPIAGTLIGMGVGYIAGKGVDELIKTKSEKAGEMRTRHQGLGLVSNSLAPYRRLRGSLRQMMAARNEDNLATILEGEAEEEQSLLGHEEGSAPTGIIAGMLADLEEINREITEAIGNIDHENGDQNEIDTILNIQIDIQQMIKKLEAIRDDHTNTASNFTGLMQSGGALYSVLNFLL